MEFLVYAAPIAGITALVFAYGLAVWIGKVDEGTERMKEIASYIREGAMAFLRREYKTMVVFVTIMFIILWIRD